MAGEGEGGVVEGVGFDEGAVEIDAEDRERGDVGLSEARDRQKCPSLRLNQ